MQTEHYPLLLLPIKSVELAKHRATFIVKKPKGNAMYLSPGLALTVVVHQKYIYKTGHGHFLTADHFLNIAVTNERRRHSELIDEKAAGDRLHTSNSITVSCSGLENYLLHDQHENRSCSHYCLTSLLKQHKFGCTVNRYTSCSCVVFMKKVAAQRVFNEVLNNTTSNHRCRQINQDWNLKDYNLNKWERKIPHKTNLKTPWQTQLPWRRSWWHRPPQPRTGF